MASFKIGREFFAKAKADYADWRWSWVREISQNSMDCGSSRIDVTIERDGANTQIAVPRHFTSISRLGRVPSVSWDDIVQETAAIFDGGPQSA